MQSSDTLKELAPALAAAQADFKSVHKSGFNKFDRYSYAGLEDYVAAVRDTLAAHGLSFVTSVEEVVALEPRPTKNDGTQHAVRVRIVGRIIHKSGEWQEVSTWGEGQDRGDKAIYKAITGGRKYILAEAFNLATTDDPEQDSPPATQHQQQNNGRQWRGNDRAGTQAGATNSTAPTRAEQRPPASPPPSDDQRRVIVENGKKIDADTGEEIGPADPLATGRQVAELRALMKQAGDKLKPGIEAFWLRSAGVNRLEELTSVQILKCVRKVRSALEATTVAGAA